MQFSYKEQHVLVSLYEGGDIAQCAVMLETLKLPLLVLWSG